MRRNTAKLADHVKPIFNKYRRTQSSISYLWSWQTRGTSPRFIPNCTTGRRAIHLIQKKKPISPTSPHGTHVAQICLFLLVESRQIPGVLLQTAPPKNQRRSMISGDVGNYEIIDLDLARYDVLAERLAAVRDDAVRYLKSGIPTPKRCLQPHDCRNRTSRTQFPFPHSTFRPDRSRQIYVGNAGFLN